MTLHSLPNTAVSQWSRAGVQPKQVQVWGAHSSVASVLDRYGHLYDDDGADKMARLGALIDGAASQPLDGNVIQLNSRN